MANRKIIAMGMARDVVTTLGREILLARTNLGLSVRAAARLAGVSPTTLRRVEAGSPTVRVDVLCQVATAVGLKVWGKAFPVSEPSLRDTGQLRIAEWLMGMAHSALRPVVELGLGNHRSIDLVFFGAEEIIAVEIYRMMADFQAQLRAADAKRMELAAAHQRPVRLVLAVEDTRRNRRVMAEHAVAVGVALPAGSRAVLSALRSGTALDSDGLVWIRASGR